MTKILVTRIKDKNFQDFFLAAKDNKVFIENLINYLKLEEFTNKNINSYFYELYQFSINMNNFKSEKHEILYNVLSCRINSTNYKSKLGSRLIYLLFSCGILLHEASNKLNSYISLYILFFLIVAIEGYWLYKKEKNNKNKMISTEGTIVYYMLVLIIIHIICFLLVFMMLNEAIYLLSALINIALIITIDTLLYKQYTNNSEHLWFDFYKNFLEEKNNQTSN